MHCRGSMGFAVEESKEVLSLQMSRDHGKEMPIMCVCVCVCLPSVFTITRREGNKGRRSNMKKIPKYVFGRILKT